jgi:hypothetical protein
MKPLKYFSIGSFLAIMNISCFLDEENRTGKFMQKVINLEEFNSEFDDYNSSLPANQYGNLNLIFSSKRYNQDAFKLVGFGCQLAYDDEAVSLTKENRVGLSFSSDSQFMYDFLSDANGKSNFNVLGPMVLNTYNLVSYGNSPKYQFLIYADDSEKNLEIKAIYSDKSGQKVGPVKLKYLNSAKDDAYPMINFKGTKATFCSNRNGDFDIFEANLGTENSGYTISMIDQIINPNDVKINQLDKISVRGADDKCPYIWNDYILIFASNRAGGFGGFDIYYSTFQNGSWSEPVNAGPRINTVYDEYRPILPTLANFTYPLMIFSSNRPKGKGGFDLYMTGLVETDNMMKVLK